VTREVSTDDIPPTWSESSRLVPRAAVRPFQRFAATEAAGGVVVLVMAIVALVWANSPFGDAYEQMWNTIIDLRVGDVVHLELTLREWINDLAMAFFFFVVALEIKRELVRGDLRDPRVAALPALAALGGMIVPASIYFACNAGGPGAGGWGIPMATDIAFAVGVLSLLSGRVPSSLVVFLLTLAIVDDLGAIIVIAVFYTDDLSPAWLFVAFWALGLAVLTQRLDIRSRVPYILLAAVCWYALHESGVHATLAAVAFGLITPSHAFYRPEHFGARAHGLVDDVEQHMARESYDGDVDEEGAEAQSLEQLITLSVESQPPLDRLEHILVPWTTFLIVPAFALANAGVRVSFDDFVSSFSEPVTLGVLLGLVVGKPVGITLFAFAAVALGVGKLPAGATWALMIGVGMLGGVGFTVALFVTELAFEPGILADQAKIGILAASAIAGVLGYASLRILSGRARADT
jgi:NhaA family Na+:H+ antiporter